MTSRDRRLLLGLAVASMAWVLVGAFAGIGDGLAMVAPALLLLLPLLAGRYVGEEALGRVRHARGAPPLRRRGARPAAPSHPAVALVPRGGLLLASSLATWPPPALG
ncbi:hypothetical protein [Capillimicrobium parvum]|uniref:hypothetical protein n=1 Tax=Capillimicrobium parvum TaxID=2884022 RepID=UPI00216ABD8A|nr:hypothetical protein [Capillimicrobium parvum]